MLKKGEFGCTITGRRPSQPEFQWPWRKEKLILPTRELDYAKIERRLITLLMKEGMCLADILSASVGTASK